MATRYVIEGTWQGYKSSQDRVVHRQVYQANRKKLRAWVEKTFSILFTDGTSLLLSVRDCEPYERVKQLRGYTELIENCAHFDVSSVAALQAARLGAFDPQRHGGEVLADAPVGLEVLGALATRSSSERN